MDIENGTVFNVRCNKQLGMTRSEQLRRRYPVFRYERFEIEKSKSRITVRFLFSIPPDISFTPEVQFDGISSGWHSVPEESLKNAVFHLGLIEAFSYWKATTSPVIEVLAGALTAPQVDWWEDLVVRGMGEFFYVNEIDFTAADFLKIVPAGGDGVPAPFSGALPQRSLLEVGGGRDSALAAAVLRDGGVAFTCMMLNPSSAARKIASYVGGSDPVVIHRDIRRELLELNRRDFLNGHTPFSAYLAFLGVLATFLYGCSNVIVANERSSDEGNVLYLGREVNHQYSKSFRFERLFDEYLQKHIAAHARYFSYVRPLYELQIGQLFSKYSEMFDLFKSCNRNRSDSWCGRCPKCLSVFLTMYPFAPQPALLNVFGADLFDMEENIPILRKLAGFEVKPFECVATAAEIKAALALSIGKVKAEGRPLPRLLEWASQNVDAAADANAAASILNAFGPHRIPQELESFLTKAWKSSPRSR